MQEEREHCREKNHCNVSYRHGSWARKQRSVLMNEEKEIHTLRLRMKWLFGTESCTQNKLIGYPRTENSTCLCSKSCCLGELQHAIF